MDIPQNKICINIHLQPEIDYEITQAYLHVWYVMYKNSMAMSTSRVTWFNDLFEHKAASISGNAHPKSQLMLWFSQTYPTLSQMQLFDDFNWSKRISCTIAITVENINSRPNVNKHW